MNTEVKDTEKKEEKKVIILIVNAEPKPWEVKTISFEQVVVLAFHKCEDDPTICTFG